MQQTSFDTQTFDAAVYTVNKQAKKTGSLTEIIIDEGSSLQAFHLISLLMQCKIEDRWLMWLSPNKGVNKQWLHSLGLAAAPIVYMETGLDNQAELAKRILAAKTSHLVLEWLGPLDAQTQAELSHLARFTSTEVMLVRKR